MALSHTLGGTARALVGISRQGPCRLMVARPRACFHAAARAPARSSTAANAYQSRRQLSSYAILDGLFGKKRDAGGKEGKSDGLLKWARSATKGCELAPATAPLGLKLATFAGGCFWGLELALQRCPGVVSTSVGYTGGQMKNPTYDMVCMEVTGHAEAVQCIYDPAQVTYDELLDVLFDKVDPTTPNRQGNDYGTQYRSAIYFHDEEQKEKALQRVAAVNEQLAAGTLRKGWIRNKVAAQVEPAGDYYLAEAYHQQYLQKGGRFGMGQSAAKGCKDPIRCYG